MSSKWIVLIPSTLLITSIREHSVHLTGWKSKEPVCVFSRAQGVDPFHPRWHALHSNQHIKLSPLLAGTVVHRHGHHLWPTNCSVA